MKRISSVALIVMLVLTLAVGGISSVFAGATTKSLSTNYTIQNLSDIDMATIHVEYSLNYDGVTPGGSWAADAGNVDFTVDPGASKVIAQYFDTTMVDGAGSAVVESDQPVAAIVNMLARGQTPTSGSYTGFSEGGQSFFMPFAFKTLPTSVGIINSQLIIQNVGTSSTNVSVALINGSTGAVDYTKNIIDLPVGESFYYDQTDEAALPDAWFGSAKVVADTGAKIAVVGNQFTGDHGLLTYPGFPEGYTEWVVPLYLSRLANGYNSVIAIQNVSGGTISEGDITVYFTPDPSLSGTPFDLSLPSDLNDNSTWILNPRGNADFPVDSYGAARIVSTTGNVVAIVNQLVNEPPNFSSSALSYNAIRADLIGQTVRAPLIMSRLGNGYSTVFTVANLTASPGTCTFTYKPDPSLGLSDTVVTDVPLPASSSIVHNHRLSGAGTHELPTDWYGAATVACTRAVGGVVNQLQTGAAGDPALSYNAFTTP
jgi:hypothetical protein